VSESWKPAKAGDVTVGDVVRTSTGTLITVSRIETSFLGRPALLAFIQDTPERWYKHPIGVDVELEIREN
jgi:hypothetical protein